MQVYLQFMDKMDVLIEKSTLENLQHFGLSICKNLYPDYESFSSEKERSDHSLLLEAIQICEKTIDDQKINNQLITYWIEEIKKIIPDPEDHSNWQSSFAFNASQAVLEFLLFIQDSDIGHISEICSLNIDTIDFKIAQANESLSDDGIYKHPLMLEAMDTMIKFFAGK